MVAQALTVGVGTVMDAKEVLVLITGANKAIALYKVKSTSQSIYLACNPGLRRSRKACATCGLCLPSSSTPTP